MRMKGFVFFQSSNGSFVHLKPIQSVVSQTPYTPSINPTTWRSK
jgi:hypothetical protein